MPRLLHINGPSGAGKSTVARRWSAEHPGSLDLEIDHVASMLGGWPDDFWGTFAAARRLGFAMAETHLRAGYDVVLPQLVTSPEEAARFEQSADRADAAYIEVVLLVTPAEQVRRFRLKSRGSAVDRVIGGHVEDRGGETLLNRIHGHLTSYAEERPAAHRIETDGLDPETTYAALARLVT